MLERLPAAVGRALKNVRPGLEKIVAARKEMSGVPCSLVVTSPAFGDFDPMPRAFTADGRGDSPPIAWSGVPQITRSIVVIVEDADSPTPLPLVHAIVLHLPAVLTNLEAGAIADGLHAPLLGRNSYMKKGWLPPDPPPGHGAHRYAFQLFALDRDLEPAAHPGRSAFVRGLEGHVLGYGLLVGSYSR
jgi:Raf kinase inhibitor-like YbhB/YbcL family protein